MSAAPSPDLSRSPTWLGETFDSTIIRFPRAPTGNAEVALALAEAGLAIFPASLDKRPQPGFRWQESSSCDAQAVERWWDRYPNALPAIDCAKSGLVVLDLDRHGDGPDGVAAGEALLADLHALGAPITDTRNSGKHVFFRIPPGENIGNATGALPAGIDVRSRGYVVAPGATLPDGTGWRSDPEAPDLAEAFADGTIPELPAHVLALIRQRPERPEPPRAAVTNTPLTSGGGGERERAFARAALDACAGELASTGAGGRNEALNAASYRMGRQIGAGRIGRGEVERELESAAEACGLVADDGWPSIRKTMASGLDAGVAQPADALVDREGWGEQFAAHAALGAETARALAGDAAIPPRATLMVDGVKIDAETGEIVEAHAAADAPTQAQRPPVVDIRTVNAASFADQPVPRQRWLIEDLVPAANVGIIAGDGAVGKSLLALQLCVAVALGGEWIGFRPAGGRALYVSCEDEEPELHRRLHRLCPDLAALANLDLIDLAGKDAVMAAPDRAGLLKPTGLYAAIRHVIATRRPSLIVLDNLSDTFGGDEVKRVHARQFIALMRALALEFDTTVLILQHPSQGGLASGSGTSGSTGWSNGVRTRLFLERRIVREGNAQVEADRDIRILLMKKANRSPLGDQIVIRWEDGRFIREELRSFNLRDAAQHAKRTFVKLLRLHAAQGRNLSAHKCSTYAPAVFERHPGADGVTGSAFALAMERLLEAGTIAVEEVGSPSKRRQRLVVIAEGEPETFATSDEDGAPSGDAR